MPSVQPFTATRVPGHKQTRGRACSRSARSGVRRLWAGTQAATGKQARHRSAFIGWFLQSLRIFYRVERFGRP
ncbi:hypothetical protein C0Z19_16065 [Trinickia soli]|uniref:Uncharacterized protein n=1 Tax=Trinickia soli TaxID=380675 RepID=A0A2N7W069_9BURK|nr:hypothetical protein C0Z19_16065 [Trinickia soli]